MPYRHDIWVPETNPDFWEQRGVGIRGRQAWLGRSGANQGDLHEFETMSADEQMSHLKVLAGDIGEAQRDGFLYANHVEWLKNSIVPVPPKCRSDPDEVNDPSADLVVDRMITLGMASATWPASEGGPPEHHSPRFWRPVLDWLLQLIRQVGEFLMNSLRSFMKFADALGLGVEISAVAINVSVPPGVSLEFVPHAFDDKWQMLKDLVDEMIAGLTRELSQPH